MRVPNPVEFSVLTALAGSAGMTVGELHAACDPDVVTPSMLRERLSACHNLGFITFGLPGHWRLTARGKRAYQQGIELYDEQDGAPETVIDFDEMLLTLVNEGKKDRADVNEQGFPVDDKRAVAMMVTKLEEAAMWKDKAKNYYEGR